MAPAAMLWGVIAALILFSFIPATSNHFIPPPQCIRLRDGSVDGSNATSTTYTYDASKNDTVVDAPGQCYDTVRVIVKQRYTNWRGIPTYEVRVIVSTLGPGIYNLMLRCENFYSAISTDPRVFRPIGNGLCLVNDGKLIRGLPPIFFSYQNYCQELPVASFRCITASKSN